MTTTELSLSTAETDESAAPRRRVAYLLGAGATQGCVSYSGSRSDLSMRGLLPQLIERWRDLVYSDFTDEPSVERLLNDVVTEDTDFEHLLTFLDDAPSEVHQDLADELKVVFSTVLRGQLDQVTSAVGDDHSFLYAALVDMHAVEGAGEELAGFLTLNYDVFLEHAIQNHLGLAVDFGVQVGAERADDADTVRVLKLHGSFGWHHKVPIEQNPTHRHGLWIPPGIRKEKAEYPFNAIWGLARELLDCDVLRIIGCNLGANDWDLISLLFTTLHTTSRGREYEVEVIARPKTADRIGQQFPYLNVKSLLDLADVGPQVVSEMRPGEPQSFHRLDGDERDRVRDAAQRQIHNAFEYWLRRKGEVMLGELGAVSSPSGVFEAFVDRGA